MVSVISTSISKRMLLIFHLLLLIYPLLYFMQQNIAEFPVATYLNTLLYIIVYEIVLSALYIFSQKYRKTWMHTIYIVLLALGLCAVLCVTLCCNLPIMSVFTVLTLLSVSYILYYKNIIKPFVLILGVMCIFSVIRFSKPLLFSHVNEDLKEYPQMKMKPNIYFLILESYHGDQALKQLYAFDNSAFWNYLTQNGFTLYNDVYATRATTRLSLLSIFTSSNTADLYEKEYLLDGCLTGKAHCKVLDILRANGYTIKNKFANNYLVHDYFDAPNQHKFLCNTLFSKQYPDYFSKCFNMNYQYKTVNDFNADVMETINSLTIEDSPYMFITKIGGISEDFKTYTGGVVHIPNFTRHTDMVDIIPKFKKSYTEEMEKENIALIHIISTIIAKDSEAMIVMFGDHGAGYLDILKEKANQISPEIYLLDFFNVMAAIRFPKGGGTIEQWQYLPQMFNVIFEFLGTPIDKTEIQQTFYDHENNSCFE